MFEAMFAVLTDHPQFNKSECNKSSICLTPQTDKSSICYLKEVLEGGVKSGFVSESVM